MKDLLLWIVGMVYVFWWLRYMSKTQHPNNGGCLSTLGVLVVAIVLALMWEV